MTDLNDLRTYRVRVDISDIDPGSTAEKTHVIVDVMHRRGASTEDILALAREIVLSKDRTAISGQTNAPFFEMSLPVVTGSQIVRSWD